MGMLASYRVQTAAACKCDETVFAYNLHLDNGAKLE